MSHKRSDRHDRDDNQDDSPTRDRGGGGGGGDSLFRNLIIFGGGGLVAFIAILIVTLTIVYRNGAKKDGGQNKPLPRFWLMMMTTMITVTIVLPNPQNRVIVDVRKQSVHHCHRKMASALPLYLSCLSSPQ